MEAIKTDKRIKAFFKSIFKKKRYDPSECFPFEELPPELMFNVRLAFIDFSRSDRQIDLQRLQDYFANVVL
jgi:hypothetical protein